MDLKVNILWILSCLAPVFDVDFAGLLDWKQVLEEERLTDLL